MNIFCAALSLLILSNNCCSEYVNCPTTAIIISEYANTYFWIKTSNIALSLAKSFIFVFVSLASKFDKLSNLQSKDSSKGVSNPAESIITIPFPSFVFISGYLRLIPSVLILNPEGTLNFVSFERIKDFPLFPLPTTPILTSSSFVLVS